MDTKRAGPPIKEIPAAPRWMDTQGVEHKSYAEAYKASVRAKLAKLIYNQSPAYDPVGNNNALAIADAIMKELTVSWP